MPLSPGTFAPDFALPGSDGREWRLEAVLAASSALLIFYPGNHTPG